MSWASLSGGRSSRRCSCATWPAVPYSRSLTSTFVPELLSMNLLMAGMIPTMMALKMRIASAVDPLAPSFWFVMSMALLVGFVLAYPINWWLVAYQLKHGMMTVRPATDAGHEFAPHAGT